MREIIYQGDALEVLRTLSDESVNCCVTSPPYWGLRDYGTGLWTGGDTECKHKNRHSLQGQDGQRANRSFTGEQNFFRQVCRLCGAVRVDSQIGLELTYPEYVSKIVAVFSEVFRVLRLDGTLWLNLGDSYAGGKTGRTDADRPSGHQLANGQRGSFAKQIAATVGAQQRAMPDCLKQKDLIGIPWRVAFALQASGWYLRSDVIWHKSNPMPESVTDRPTRAHEYMFLFAKSERYY